MTTRRSFHWLGLILLASCATGGGNAAVQPPSPSATSSTAPPSFPRSVAEFVLQNRQRYEDASAGERVGYGTSTGLRADAYVYPLTPGALDSARKDVQATARAEMGKSTAAIRIFEQRGTYSDVVMTEPQPLDVAGPSGHRIEGTYVGASLVLQNRQAFSDIYVFILGGSYLKIRATYPRDASAVSSRQAIRTFASALAVTLDAAAP